VVLDIKIKKELPVQVDWIGKLPIYLVLTDVKVKPEKVAVVGGRSILEKISTLYTEKIRLDTIEKSGEITANLALEPASLKVAQASKKQVKITYVVGSVFSEDLKEE